jgi:general secretion pathway protein G
MSARRRYRQVMRGDRGFTLIEVMIVIAIILMLSTLVGVALMSRRKDAQKDLAQYDMGTIANAIKLFEMDFDRFPTDEEGLRVLWDKSALSPDSSESKWRGYLEKPMPTDKWGSPWGYRQMSEQGNETKYDLWSYGPDKEDGTDDDLTNWATTEEDDGFAPPR